MNYIFLPFGTGIALLKVMKKWEINLKLLPLTVLVLLNIHSLSLAGNTATIMVSATVMARVNQSVTHQESRITVTEMDIKKGFIEIPSATILQIKTNTKNGYVLLFEGGSELFKEVWVTDSGRTVVLSPSGGLIHQSFSGSQLETKELSFRFNLREDIQPGIYPFPFRVKASLL